MAPGTRPASHSNFCPEFPSEGNMFEANFDDVAAESDPWSGATDPDSGAQDTDQGFEDSFISNDQNDSEFPTNQQSVSYESNKDYLNYLESKLQRMETKRKNTDKVNARDVLKSLKDVKEKQMQWSFQQQGVSSSEGDTFDSDSGHSSGSGNSLTNELRRKMFPEQHAQNDTELLHLLDHDVIQKLFLNVQDDSASSSKT
ncbi:uncharacterized protein LOC144428188 [Styela clava]